MDEQIPSTPGTAGQEFTVSLEEWWLASPILQGQSESGSSSWIPFSVRNNYIPATSSSYIVTSASTSNVQYFNSDHVRPSSGYVTAYDPYENYQAAPKIQPIPELLRKKSIFECITLTKQDDQTKEGNS